MMSHFTQKSLYCPSMLSEIGLLDPSFSTSACSPRLHNNKDNGASPKTQTIQRSSNVITDTHNCCFEPSNVLYLNVNTHTESPTEEKSNCCVYLANQPTIQLWLNLSGTRASQSTSQTDTASRRVSMRVRETVSQTGIIGNRWNWH